METGQPPNQMPPSKTFKTATCGKCGQVGHYSTHHFKHEDHPDLATMREDWERRYWDMMNRASPTRTPEEKTAMKAEADALFKEQKHLWSHRKLMCLDTK